MLCRLTSGPTTSDALQLLIAELPLPDTLLITQPISFTDIKTCFLGYRLSSIKVCGAFELLQKTRILLELGKQG